MRKADFALMKQEDVRTEGRFIQMPRWIMTLGLTPTAKVVYALLLNRMELSRKNGWVDEEGQVYLIYSREELAQDVGVSEKCVTAAMKDLRQKKLVWEVRRGLGRPNLIFLALLDPAEGKEAPRSGEPVRPSTGNEKGVQQFPKGRHGNDTNRNKTEKSYTDINQTYREAGDGWTEEKEKLNSLLEQSDLDIFQTEERETLEAAVVRLFYAKKYRLGQSELPQSTIRAYLERLDGTVLQDVLSRLRSNENEVRNPFGFIMSTLLNCLAAGASETLVDPYINSLYRP